MTVKLLRAFWELFRDTILEIQSKRKKHEMIIQNLQLRLKTLKSLKILLQNILLLPKVYFLLGVKDMNEKC